MIYSLLERKDGIEIYSDKSKKGDWIQQYITYYPYLGGFFNDDKF